MAKPTSNGTCMLCEKTYSRAGMGQHLKACRKKVGLQGVIGGKAHIRTEHGSYHVAVEDRYDPRYWLHLEMPMDLDLLDLDRFLRDIWLECCGHLSSFDISGVTYRSLEIDPLEPFGGRPPENMQFAGHRVLQTGKRFKYEYDFGTTTELALRVVSEQAVKLGKSIRLLAINDPPRLVCHSCKSASADVICTECSMESFPSLDRGHLCIVCLGRHDCDDMEYLPVINSPRVGMCGYMG
ncbi:MAG: hypothetical protein OXF41_13970 [bacterium]|nr:hypothetical protein [bacterium]